jgi:hypothetical protein
MGERLSLGSTVGVARPGSDVAGAVPCAQETLVVDARAQLRPAEMVERKLMSILRAVPLPVSHVSASHRRR